MRGRPHREERAECNACAYGVDAQRRIVFDKGEQGFHQIAVLSLECRLYVRQYFQHGNGAQHHHACRNEVHFAPTQHFADKPADDARGEYAGEQTGYDDAYVASFILRTGKLGSYRHEDLRYHGADSGDERSSPYDVDVGGRTYGDEREYQQGKVCQDNLFPPVEVAQWHDEQQTDSIAHLRYHGDKVGFELGHAQLVAYYVQQGLVIVQIGYRDTCHDSKRPEYMCREPSVFL